MKISGSISNALNDIKAKRTKDGAAKASEQSSSAKSSVDQVHVSKEAKLLSEARQPEVPDKTRIDSIKEAIREGAFKIDTSRIAQNMLREEH